MMATAKVWVLVVAVDLFFVSSMVDSVVDDDDQFHISKEGVDAAGGPAYKFEAPVVSGCPSDFTKMARTGVAWRPDVKDLVELNWGSDFCRYYFGSDDDISVYNSSLNMLTPLGTKANPGTYDCQSDLSKRVEAYTLLGEKFASAVDGWGVQPDVRWAYLTFNVQAATAFGTEMMKHAALAPYMMVQAPRFVVVPNADPTKQFTFLFGLAGPTKDSAPCGVWFKIPNFGSHLTGMPSFEKDAGELEATLETGVPVWWGHVSYHWTKQAKGCNAVTCKVSDEMVKHVLSGIYGSDDGGESYGFGDVTKAAVTSFTGKDTYEFGNISRTLGRMISGT